MTHRSWIAFSGFTWFCIGSFLLIKGLRLISEGLLLTDSLSYQMKGFFGSQQNSAVALISIGLLVGMLKGRTVLAKTVRRVVDRIRSLPLPIRFLHVYSPAYGILIGSMVLLGLSFRFLPIAVDFRGTLDVAIGSALINGALLYFRAARELNASPSGR